MKYLIWIVMCSFFIVACENTRQSIGISTKPLQSGESFENSTKLNWKITWGKIRSSKSEEDED